MELEEVLYKYFGYTSFREPQKEVINKILAKEDTLTILPTGMGKSIIYQVPGLILEGIVLVVSPLISLMQDQVSNLKKRGIKACFISGELNYQEIKEIYTNLDRYKFIYVSAERLENYLFKKHIKNISMIVIDEAHTIKWGADFRYSLYKINNFINSLEYRPIIACFTATLNKRDIDLVIRKTGLIKPYITNYLPLKNNIEYIVYKNKNILNKLLNKKGKIIVYTLTRYNAEVLYDRYKNIYSCHIYHGGMNKEDKSTNYLNFKKDSNGVMFATNAFGMGIDIPDIRHIILYDLPINLSDLVQQAGRAGRDGNKSYCYILFSLDSIKISLSFIYGSSNQKEKKKDLDIVVKFCFTRDKNKYIKEYFLNK